MSRRAQRIARIAGILATVLLSPEMAAAQTPSAPSAEFPPPEDSARLAEALFDDAKQALERGDFAEACSKLEESRRLDPAGGTQLALAVCYERGQRLASAWYAYREALAAAQRDARADREKIARERLDALEPRLSHIVVTIAPESLEQQGLHIVLGGIELRRASLGVPIPHDGGKYELAVTAPGFRTWKATIELRAAEDRREIWVPRLAPSERADPKPAPRSPRASPHERPSRRERPPPTAGAVERRVAYVFAGASLASLLSGMYFGGRALAGAGSTADACDGNVCPTSVRAERQSAEMDALRADAFIGAGVLAAAVSVFFFVTGTDTRRTGAAAGRPHAMSVHF